MSAATDAEVLLDVGDLRPGIKNDPPRSGKDSTDDPLRPGIKNDLLSQMGLRLR